MSIGDFARRYWSGELGSAGAALDLLLTPAELAYRAVIGVRNRAYDRGTLRTGRASVPIISVGNIAVGGSGKTPFTSWLARHLAARGERPAIVHGGYAVDEPALHRLWTPDVPVIVDRNRVSASERAMNQGASVVVLDDAFQHRRLARDLDIVLVSAERWTPSLRLLPRGPWREPSSALERADLLVCVRRTEDHRKSMEAARQMGAVSGRPVVRVHLDARRWVRNGEASSPPAEPAVVVAALADPDLFVANVRAAGANVDRVLTYPDHHDYTAGDAEHIRDVAAGAAVITSAKDWVKLSTLLDADGVWVLMQDVIVEEGLDILEAALDGVLR